MNINYHIHLHPQKNQGKLAQLVQSTSFTPRGSGVRIPHFPQKSKKAIHFGGLFDFYGGNGMRTLGFDLSDSESTRGLREGLVRTSNPSVSIIV